MNPTQTHATLKLTRRMRRLRRTDAMRALVRETRLSPDMFMLPLFVCEGRGVRRERARRVERDLGGGERDGTHVDGRGNELAVGAPFELDRAPPAAGVDHKTVGAEAGFGCPITM